MAVFVEAQILLLDEPTNHLDIVGTPRTTKFILSVGAAACCMLLMRRAAVMFAPAVRVEQVTGVC